MLLAGHIRGSIITSNASRVSHGHKASPISQVKIVRDRRNRDVGVLVRVPNF